MTKINPEATATFKRLWNADDANIDAATGQCLHDSLRIRSAQPDELEKLAGMRKECGWGEDELREHWNGDDRLSFVLEATMPDGQAVEVGMCGLILDGNRLASRAEGLIKLSGLYVRSVYRRHRLGSRATELLESIAAERPGAKWTTLDTVSRRISLAEDESHFIEEEDVPSSTRALYERLGYKVFAVNLSGGRAADRKEHSKFEPDVDMPIHFVDMKKSLSGRGEASR